MQSKTDYSKIASTLVGGKPLDYSHKDDGSLVVIAPNGQKFKFTFDQVEETAVKLKPKPRTQKKAGSSKVKANS